jgi:hypothetical protein
MLKELKYKSSKRDEHTLQELIGFCKGWFSFVKNIDNTYDITYNPYYDKEIIKKNLSLKKLFNTFCMIVYGMQEGYDNKEIIDKVKQI